MKAKKLLVDTLLGLLASVCLLLVFESVLWGLGHTRQSSRVSGGFDRDAAYFVPDASAEGAWRTQFINKKAPDRTIPAKSGRTRVLLFGGSNTQGFPPGWLQKQLDACAAPERFEVINLGRSGFGSGRVAIIFEQALELLEPDIVIVYTGHNEFVERGFEMDLERAWSGGTLGTMTDWIAGSRTVGLVSGLLEERQVRMTTKPEDWEWEYNKFAKMPYEETLLFYEAYERNLRSMASAAREHAVPMILSTVVHNRFARPFVATLPEGFAQADAFDAHLTAARAIYPDYFTALLPGHEELRVHQFDWGPGGREQSTGGSAATLPALRKSLGAMAERDPLWRRPKSRKPKVAEFYRDYARFVARELPDRAQLEAAERELEAALALYDRHAHAWFELALVRYVLERPVDVVAEAFDKAGRFDQAPRKAGGVSNEIVRNVAAEPGVSLFDADALFSERAEDGLFGWEWMTDHCHLSLGAMRILMEDFATFICRDLPR